MSQFDPRVASAQPSAARPPPPGVIGGPSLTELSAEVDRSGEEINLVCWRLATARLMDAEPGSIVFKYFSERREMPYKGRKVVHISKTCPDLWQVRTCIILLFFVLTAFLQEGTHSRVYQAMSKIIIENMVDTPRCG